MPENPIPKPPTPDMPPAEPILRLNTTAHTTTIWRIATDRDNRFAVTASDDKTARIWSLPDGQLLKVLRVPIDSGDMGKLYAVAMTPDGGTIALGGWTGIPGKNDHSIYLIDPASGAIGQRLSGLPNVVDHLAYSKDGGLLAAALGGSNGIRVYDAGRAYEPLPSDADYGDRSYWADFDRDGRLVTACYDGFVRLYAAGRYEEPISKVKGRGGKRPFSAVFSPDGERIAVGYDDGAAVDLLRADDLSFLQAADTSGVGGPNIFVTGWSNDSRYLFAGGRGNGTKVRRWEDGGPGRHIDIECADNTVLQLLPLKEGGVLFATADPAFGVIDIQGRKKILQGPGQLDFRADPASLRVAEDGRTIATGAIHPPRKIRFDLAARQLDIDLPDETEPMPAVTEAPGLKVTGWRNEYNPAVNGNPIALASGEDSRSLAILQGDDGFILGTEWWVRRYDRDAKLSWREPVPGIPWGVNVTPDGRLVVSAHGDGTIRWRRADDGKELLALFVDPDGKRWIVWTPQGYFDASVGADELIGWHVNRVNRGFDQAPDFFPVAQFRDRFYRADIIAKVLDTLDIDEALRQADAAAGQRTAKAAPITAMLPPVVQIHEPPAGASATDTVLKVTYSARSSTGDPVTRVEAQIDSRKTDASDQVIPGTGDTRVGILSVELPRRDAIVSVIAYNKHGASTPASVPIIWAGRGSEPKPKLYILPIGVGTYNEERLNLRFPAKDAEDFVKTVSERSFGLYERVIPSPLPKDGRWTHDDVLDGLDWIRKGPTNNDVAMVFVSGHGVVTPDQVYRFLPCNFNSDRIERTTVRSVEFQDFLSKIGGKVLVFLDTCYSGDVLRGGKAPLQSSLDKFANELAAAENGAVVFASSTGNQLSWEDPAWGNGAFTKALVEGLRGKADRAKSGIVRVAALEDYVYDRVKELTDGKQKPMVAKPKMIENFPIVAVTG